MLKGYLIVDKAVLPDFFSKVVEARQLLESGEKVVLGGDYNVILTDNDVYNPELFRGNALFRDEVRQRLKAVEFGIL